MKIQIIVLLLWRRSRIWKQNFIDVWHQLRIFWRYLELLILKRYPFLFLLCIEIFFYFCYLMILWFFFRTQMCLQSLCLLIRMYVCDIYLMIYVLFLLCICFVNNYVCFQPSCGSDFQSGRKDSMCVDSSVKVCRLLSLT